MGKRGDNQRALPFKRAKFVAAYVGPANGNATEAARIAGYAHPGQEGHALLKNPEIRTAIDDHRAEIKRQGIACQQNRIDAKNERWLALQEIRRIRAARYSARFDTDDPEIAAAQAAKDTTGGYTPFEATLGYLVEKESVNNAGHRTVEWAIDTALLSEQRALEMETAKELGQLTEKHEVSGGIQREYVIVRDSPAAPIEPEAG